MRYEEFQLNGWLKTVTLEERSQIETAIEKRFHKKIGLEPEDLAAMDLELLIPLRDLVRGVYWTNSCKPDMKEAYQALWPKDLPRKSE